MAEGKQTWREAQAAAREAAIENAFGMPIAEIRIGDAVQQAEEAAARGDSLLQIEVPIEWVQGAIGVGDYVTRYRGDPRPGLLDAVEARGWRLEHMNTVYIEQGTAATKRMLANAGSTLVAAHGMVLSVYVFRRAQP